MVTAAARAVEQIQFRITLNEDGEFTGLANHDQVSQQLQTMAGVMIKQLLGTAPAAQRAQIESLMGQVLTPELLISSATRDVQIYVGLNGASLAPGETLEVPLDQPSPFGGGTLAATYRVHMESSAAEFASVSTTMNYDAEGLRRMTAALMKQVGANIPPAELEAMPPIQLTDDGKYSYDRTFGIMREAAVTRRISSGPMRRLDGWTIRMISAPKR